MKNRIPTCRILLVASLATAGTAVSASAQQDPNKSYADILNAVAANKQAEAAMVNALGNYSKAAADAAKTDEETREKAAHNDVLETESYYKKRAQYYAFRAGQRTKPTTTEANTEAVSRPASTELTSYHYDRNSGDLRWPTLLMHEEYDSMWRRIDSLLGKRTRADSGAGSQNCIETLKVVNEMAKRLRDNIRRYSSHDYLAARNFLRAVALEVRRPIEVLDVQTLDRVASQ